ncbi:MAG: hypothetical protein ACFCVB_20775 [Nodosilinea sp.]
MKKDLASKKVYGKTVAFLLWKFIEPAIEFSNAGNNARLGIGPQGKVLRFAAEAVRRFAPGAIRAP